MSLITKSQVKKGSDKVKAGAVKARKQARQQARQAAVQAGPLTSSAKATARHRVYRMRAWTAPRLVSSGRALEERVAPKMSKMMSTAARRIDPDSRKRRRWPFLIAGIVTLVAAAGAAMKRRGSSATAWHPGDQAEDAATTDAKAGQADTPAAANAKVHTSS